jgi:signal transduction histidine kinase
MLRSGAVQPERVPHALEAVQRNAEIQNRLIEDLLDVSRIVTGKLRLEIHDVDLRDVLDAALASLHPAAEAKSLCIETAVDPTLLPVRGDPQRLQQVLWNLLANAVKFTPAGGHVWVEILRGGAAVEIVVRDDGEGIAAADLPHVFERFRQADGGSTRTSAGLGLGLAIVRHIVEMHGGTVEAHSDGRGRGTTFKVSMPMVGALAG